MSVPKGKVKVSQAQYRKTCKQYTQGSNEILWKPTAIKQREDRQGNCIKAKQSFLQCDAVERPTCSKKKTILKSHRQDMVILGRQADMETRKNK